jgi:hypothetical protein
MLILTCVVPYIKNLACSEEVNWTKVATTSMLCMQAMAICTFYTHIETAEQEMVDEWYSDDVEEDEEYMKKKLTLLFVPRWSNGGLKRMFSASAWKSSLPAYTALHRWRVCHPKRTTRITRITKSRCKCRKSVRSWSG